MPHPAIKRGHFDTMRPLVRDVTVGRADRPGVAGLRTVGVVPVLCRVVVAGLDIEPYLRAGGADDGPRDLTSGAFVRRVAPYLREGLIDPGNGTRNRHLPPVVAMETEAGLCFVQAVACLN